MSEPLPGAQAHIEAALKLAARIDDIPADTPLIPIAKVGVIGAGTMGGGITMNFLSAGIPVTIVEQEQAALDRGVSVMGKNYEASVKRGRIEAADAQAAMARLTPSLSFDDLADCDLVIEAVYESMEVKKDVFGRLDKIVKQGAILASNTSYLDVNEIAAATTRPEAVLGMHFFSPANIMKLLEVVRGAKTGDSQLATVMQQQVQAGESRLKELFEGFIGENSQILKLLDPSEENHLVKALESTLAGAVTEQNQAILSQFSLDNKESALVRFLGELSTRHGDLNQALAQKMQAVVSEFSLDKEDSALSRLVERVERSQRNVASELSLDNQSSALSRMYKMLEDHQQNVTRSHDALAAKLDAAVQVLQAKREEAAKGTRHGVEFEAALAAHLRPLVGSGGDILHEVGATTGVISHCKVGDHVIVLGSDKVAAGAKIVIEAKENASYDLRKTLEEADLARRNRQADLCIFVHSTKTAGASIPRFQRLGKDIVVQWTADDESTDMWLQAAIMAAQAICTQINSHDKDEAASFDKIDHAIERIRRDIDGFEEINTSANTARSAAERILSRARRMKDSLEAQTDSIWEEFLKIYIYI